MQNVLYVNLQSYCETSGKRKSFLELLANGFTTTNAVKQH